MTSKARKDFFVSYNKADNDWAEWIAWQLEESGFSTIIQAWDFRPGGNFVLEIHRASQEAYHTIAILSPDYLAALYPQPEWAAALAQDPTGTERKLLPVRVRKCELKGLLAQVVYIDLVDSDELSAKERLLQGVESTRAKPSQPPKFPGGALIAAPRFPLAFPSIWNIPYIRNPNFTGREQLLQDLHDALTSGRPMALTQTVHGLGGVGKTQLALEYAYRFAPEYDLVWWCRADDPTTLSGDFAELAQELGLPEKNIPDQEAQVQATLRELRRRDGWLLILDNAEDPENTKKYQVSGGRLLITSRNPVWRGVANPLVVQVMKPEEAIDFLLKRADQTDRDLAETIAEELGYLPLALEQAGAYMDATGMPMKDYLVEFRQKAGEVLKRGKPSQDYEYTVATTWELSFQRVEHESIAAGDLLKICAFLAPDDIPKRLFIDGGDALPPSLAFLSGNPLALHDLLAALKRYSLLVVEENSLSVHRLVQVVVRDRLGKSANQKWASTALNLLNLAFPIEPETNIKKWTDCKELLSHSLAATKYAYAFEIYSNGMSELLNRISSYLTVRGKYLEAKKTSEQSLYVGERVLGPKHPDLPILISNYGYALAEFGDFEEAKAYHERALLIAEEIIDENDPVVASIVNHLGSTLEKLGDFKGAKECYERALSVDEAAYGLVHPHVARDLNDLGLLLKDHGDLKEAKEYMERAIKIDEEIYGQNHPAVAIKINNLGLILGRLGDFKEAKVCFERAIHIGETIYEGDHPHVAVWISNLGCYLVELGDLKEAKVYFERSLAIIEKTYSPDHYKAAEILVNLGNTSFQLRELEKATNYFKQALLIWEKCFGTNDPKVLCVLSNLATTLISKSDFKGAEGVISKALPICEVLYKNNQPEIAYSLNQLGDNLFLLGNLKGAKKSIERALAIEQAVYGTNHPNVALTLNSLGNVLHRMGDRTAVSQLEKALKIDEEAYGSDHPVVAKDLSNLGSVLSDMGEQKRARSLLERAIAINEAVLGPSHSEVARDVNNLGQVLLAVGNLKGAQIHFERAISIIESFHGQERREVLAASFNNLGVVLEKLGDLEGAKTYYQRGLTIAESYYGHNHPYIASSAFNLGTFLKKQGYLKEAKIYLERALFIDELAYGYSHPDVVKDMNSLGEILQELGDLEKAKAIYVRALAISRQFLGEKHPLTTTINTNLAIVLLYLPGY
jgi:tetratricopeptide (TPR) repeat protein